MSFRISRGVLTGLQDALGIRELSDASAALIATLGITLAASTVIMPMVVVSAIGTIMEVISVINSVYMAASAVKGIYSTAMGAGNRYDKAEVFAHDATMLAVSLIFLWGTASAIKNSTALFKSASQNLIGRTSRLTPSEVTQTYKGARLLTSFDDFAEYTKGFLDDDALQYAREVLGNDGDDIAGLKKIAQLIEDGSQKIGRKLSKEELKAGLDALWDDAGVEGALAAIERIVKSASVPREKRLALGKSSYLDDFAKQRNAHTWKDFPDADNWQQGVMDALFDPDTEIVFNLDGVGNPWTAITKASSGRGGATEWELLQIKSNPEVWGRVIWYQNGSIVPNPFE